MPDALANGGAKRRLPGEIGIWVFVLGDLIVFGLFFLVFLVHRSREVVLFARSQATMSQGLGAANTILLLSSSYFVARGMTTARSEESRAAARFFSYAIFCGMGFCLIKVAEYTAKIDGGITINSNDFFTFYFMLTGIHLVHVAFGIATLLFVRNISLKDDLTPSDIMMMENGSSFWHLVDILWIILFLLFYLAK